MPGAEMGTITCVSCGGRLDLGSGRQAVDDGQVDLIGIRRAFLATA